MALDPHLDTDGMELRRYLGGAVERRRRERERSRRELAMAAGVSESTVIAAEGGRGGLNVYARLLRVIGLKVTVVPDGIET